MAAVQLSAFVSLEYEIMNTFFLNLPGYWNQILFGQDSVWPSLLCSFVVFLFILFTHPFVKEFQVNIFLLSKFNINHMDGIWISLLVFWYRITNCPQKVVYLHFFLLILHVNICFRFFDLSFHSCVFELVPLVRYLIGVLARVSINAKIWAQPCSLE